MTHCNGTFRAEKVFKKMGFVIVKEDVDGAINAERGAVERILKFIRQKMADFQAKYPGTCAC